MIAEKPEIRAVGASVGLSLLGHAAGLAALIWLAAQLPPAPLQMRAPERAVDIVFEQPRAATPVPEQTPQPAEPPSPEPPSPEVAAEPTPPPEPPPVPVVEAQPPPQPRLPEPPPIVSPKPPRKPVVQKPKKPPAEPRIVHPPVPPAPITALPLPLPPSYPSQQTTALPPPAPVVSGSYRGMLSAWLEAHKRYPESARARGEQGRVGLSFRVARSGQVLAFAITGSSGYADLDAAVEAMMRGATLPPFPPDMTANDVQVSVSIRFGLAR